MHYFMLMQIKSWSNWEYWTASSKAGIHTHWFRIKNGHIFDVPLLEIIFNLEASYVNCSTLLIQNLTWFFECRLNQHLSKPTNTHFKDAVKIVIYPNNAPSMGIFFMEEPILTLTIFTYSDWRDWGACPNTRRSTT